MEGVEIRKSGCLEPDWFTQELAGDIIKAFSEVSLCIFILLHYYLVTLPYDSFIYKFHDI